MGKLASGGETADTWTEINEYGHTDPNLVSAPGWQGLNAGTPIEGKEGWYRYSHTYDVNFEGADLFRIWVYVGADANGSFLVDNVKLLMRTERRISSKGAVRLKGFFPPRRRSAPRRMRPWRVRGSILSGWTVTAP